MEKDSRSLLCQSGLLTLTFLGVQKNIKPLFKPLLDFLLFVAELIPVTAAIKRIK